MKLTAVLLLISTLYVSANTFAQRVSVKGRNMTLSAVFETIHQQTGYSFVYEPNLIKKAAPVTINVTDALVTEVLNICMKDQGLVYEIKHNAIIIRHAPAKTIPAAITAIPPKLIKGKVTDDHGQPLTGATVTIKGSSKAVTTDVNGEFNIAVDDNNAVLVFSYIGLTTQEKTVGGSTVINIKLVEAANDLNQVVVVGYGTQKKRDVTGAIASYNANDIPDRPVARVDQALVGQMAGVQVKQTTGVPGKAFSIQVRGSGSISAGNEPLYVIDGFPLAQSSPNGSSNFATGNPLDNINPNDIESIQVLKDAASAAIYGSRAANGVVLITTRQGKTGKAQINVAAYTGYTEASRKLDLLSPEEWIDRAIEMHDAAWVVSGPGRTADQTSEQRRQILGLAPGEVNTLLMIDDRWIQPGHPGLRLIDWQDEMFRKGLIQNYQLSASGGSENVKYYISGNYVNQKGMVIGMDYTSYSARANVDITASKRLKFGINLTPTFSISNDPGAEGINNVIQTGILFTPVQEDSMGLYANSFNYGQYKWGTSASSPIARLENNIGRTKRFRTLASIFGQYKILNSLSFKTSINLDNTDNNTKTYIPYTVTGALNARITQPGTGTSGSFNGYRKQTFVNENTFSFNKVLNDVHDISAVAGMSFNTDKLETASISSVGGYGSSVITTLNAASAATGNTMETKNVLISYFGRVQYGFNDKYLLSASIRRDGSSRFGDNTKWGLFPSASVGWRISEEKFFNNVRFINDLKVRASWGKSGNYNIGDYSSIPLLGNFNYSFNGSQLIGQTPNGIVNPDLSWENSQTVDVGFDASLINNRITVSFDYYDKLNSKLLLFVPVTANTGFSTLLDNAGKVRNRGWEIELNTQNIIGDDFRWTTSVNVSHNTNKVTELAGGQSQILIPSSYDIPHSILKVGEPLYSINVVKMIGILSQDDINKNVARFGPQEVGDPKYFDANGDGVIDANDRVIVGHPNPDYTWGITNAVRYKQFDLSVLVQGQWGGSIYSLLGRAVRRTGQDYTGNVLGVNRDRWRSAQEPGDGTVGKAYSNFGRIKNTDWLYSSDYWRVRNITLGYNLTKTFAAKYVRSARIYITAENFWGHDNYIGGFNPEASNTDLSGNTSFPESGDYGGLPLPRSLIFGLNITF